MQILPARAPAHASSTRRARRRRSGFGTKADTWTPA